MQPSHDSRVVVSTLPNGFINLGNSCYINSILQCVFNIMDTSLQCQVETEDASLLSFLNLFQEWLRPTVNVLNPSVFKYYLTKAKKEFDKFNNSLSQDAHEFFEGLLEFLEDYDVGQNLSQLLEGDFCSILSCTECLGIAPKVDPFYCIELELCDEQITDI